MSGFRAFKVPNRIGRLALGNGGVSVRDAVKQAEAAMETLRSPGRDSIDDCLAEIERRFGASAPLRADEPLADLYALSLNIIDVAFGLPDSGIDEAARALCDLVDFSLTREVMDWDATDVHLQALQLLRTRGQSLSPDQRADVLTGLKKVTHKRFGDLGDAAAG